MLTPLGSRVCPLSIRNASMLCVLSHEMWVWVSMGWVPCFYYVVIAGEMFRNSSVFTHLNLQPKLLYELWEDLHIFIFHKFLFGAIFAATAYYFGRCSIVFLGFHGACSTRKFIKEINYAPEKFRWHHWDSNPWPLLCLCCTLVMKPLSRDQVNLLVSCVPVKEMINETNAREVRFNSPEFLRCIYTRQLPKLWSKCKA